jgi:exonuclease III
VQYVKSFDVVCLTETFIAFDINLHVFAEFNTYFAPAKKLSQQGRHSGGVCVLVKKYLSSYIDEINIDYDQTVILKINKSLFNTDKDIVMLSSYIPPYDSPYYNMSEFDSGVDWIEQCLTDVWEMIDNFYILLCGDFNARTGKRNTLYTEEGVLRNSEEYFERFSDDLIVNGFGRKCIDVCQMFECSILNGCKFFDAEGSVTFLCQAGSSLIDYFCASNDLCSEDLFM